MFIIQMWNFEKNTIPEDEDEKEVLAFALAKYNISLLEYSKTLNTSM